MFSFPECITWLTVNLAESVAIVTLNIVTIIVFIKNRNLRKRSTYLVINLAVLDMLAGGTALYFLFYGVGIYCNLWKSSKHWVYYFISYFFLFGSLTNITTIALERSYVTFWPFRHRLIRKSVYGFVIAFVWVEAGLSSVVTVLLKLYKGQSFNYFYLLFSFCSICLMIICVCYTSIVIKVRCGAQPQHHGAARRERKLTMTLLIVAVVSLVLYLPDSFYHLLYHVSGVISSMSKVTAVRLHHTLNVLFYANALANPILYAIRMPEFRAAVYALFRRRPMQRPAAVFPLHGT